MQGSISAVIPTFNRSGYLGEAIDALLNQSRRLSQIVIWDDGSTDDTPEIARRALEADKTGSLQYFRAENQGKSAALNAALKEVRGDYIWICDDDDIACPDAAEKLAQVLDSGDAGLVAGAHTRFSVDERSGQKAFFGTGYWPDLSSGSVIRHLLEDIFFFQNACLVRRSCYETIGPFREDLSRSIDYEMFVRLGTRFPIALVDDALFFQRKHDGARGPAAQQHSAAQSDTVWLQSDREIFAALRDRLPITFYAALFRAGSPELALRAGYLQRGCVYARRCDWAAALEDFQTAADMEPSKGLSATEIDIVIRAMAGKHGNREAYLSPMRDQLLALARRGATGKTIVNALGRGSVWRAREALSGHAFGQFASVASFCARAGFRPRPSSHIGEVSEVDHLADEAYKW